MVKLSLARVRDRLSRAVVLETAGDDEDLPEKKIGKSGKDEGPKEKRKLRSLSLFSDMNAIKAAQKLYSSYISDTDGGGFTTFMHDLDKLMAEHRADSNAPINLNPEEEEEEIEDEGGDDEDSDDDDEGGGGEDDEYDGLSEKALKAVLRRKKERKALRAKLAKGDD